ncbi:MAG: peptide chain release factor N(5)-glutamine methyltransferase [Candidatus Aureabacteria bacterium]|nr:peptide chain release factor N(5)-glutamine methyltransferase [Candidatus Auribacterota bacterium]
MKHTIGEIYKKSIEYLKNKNIERPEISVQYLLSHLLNISRLQIFLEFEKIMQNDHIDKMREYIKRRALHEPVQYITGSVDFYNSVFKVNKNVLIPRPETEILVDTALKLFNERSKDLNDKTWNIADLGCGCGNIAVSFAKGTSATVKITAIDISNSALELAKKNAELNNVSDKIVFKNLSFNAFLDEKPKLHMILANPPYIDPKDKNTLASHVIAFEPHSALFGKKSGLDYPLEILTKTSYLIGSEFVLLMEIGWDQSNNLIDKCQACGFEKYEFIKDYNDFDRILKITG